MDRKSIKLIQNEILEEIQKVGAKVTYTKDLSQYSSIMTRVKRREPIINIEASLMGEKFGIVIGYPIDYEKVIRTDKFKVFHVTDMHQFKQEWNEYVAQQLKK